MRALRIICLAATFHSITSVPGRIVPFDDGNYQNSDNADGRNVEREAHRERSLESSQHPTSTTIVAYNRRGVIADPTIGTHPRSSSRHAKHRRRQRCKNRPSCNPVQTTTTRQRFATRHYGVTNESNDEYSSSLVTENGREILALRERVVTSTPLSAQNADARRLNIASVPTQNDNDNTTGLIDGKANTSYEYTEDEDVASDAKSETLVEDSEGSILLGSFEKLGEADMYGENDFEDVYVSSRSDVVPPMKHSRMAATTTAIGDDYAEVVYNALLSSISVSLDSGFPFRNGLARLFPTIGNVSTEDSRDLLKQLNFIANADEDPCQKWLNRWDKFEQAFFGSLLGLPTCPCRYPSNIFYDDKIWDEKQQKYFRWRDVSSSSQRLDVYKPGASYCVRSLPAQGSGSATAQHCCYDNNRRLLTRGSGAGTPNLVSPEISDVLHERIDVLPWRLCKGDFSRFNKVRPPNNDNNCETNPDDEEYQHQLEITKYY